MSSAQPVSASPYLIHWSGSGLPISVGQRYVRAGLTYQCIAIAQVEKTGESVVVFQDEAHGRVWVLSVAEFADGRFEGVQR